MNKNILHIMWNMALGGGAERALYQLVREQRRNNINADVLLANKGGYYADKTKEVGANVFELNQKNNIDLSVKNNFLQILKNYDAVHFHSAELGLIYLSTKLDIKRFYTHRSGWFNYPIKKLLRYKAIGYILKKYFHGISGNTNQGADSAAKLFKISRERIITTYNGIDFSLLAPKRHKNVVLKELNFFDENNLPIFIGTSGNLRKWKRTEMLLEAVAKLQNEKIHCIVVGDGESKPELMKLCGLLGIENKVSFTGRTDCVGDYLQLLDIFVLNSGMEESFGNSVVEAMGVGAPSVIMSDGGGMTEHIENEVSGFIANDQQDLENILQKLITNPELRKNIGSYGKTRVYQAYQLEGLVERYEKLYSNQLKKNI